MLSFVPKPIMRIALLALVVLGFLLPNLVEPYTIRVAATILVFTVFATGLNLILGFGGLLSFGHAAMFGAGAYIAARLMLDTGMSLALVIVCSVLGTAVFGLLVGITSWRVGGDYLALITLGAGQIFYLYLNNAKEVTGGATGLPGIPPGVFFGWDLTAIENTYLFILGATIVATAFAWLIGKSFLGRSLLAIREDEVIARAHGINVPLTKVIVFGIGAGIAGLAGVLQVLLLGFVGPASFTVDQSILAVEIVLIGGMATTLGPFLGSILVIGSTEYLRSLADYRSMIFGALMVLILLWKPGGLVQILGLGETRASKATSLSALLAKLRRSGTPPSRHSAHAEPVTEEARP
ncbi:branched-chain amino acid ABC transporter permease [Nocardioides marmoriginsengisoli]|uniref:Branched-chain amino acid ABC transporter permease n=1 Tax=Nocardioides marmoriginsengisoli TaxID=661483 RepID=A0A3N0CGB8_9ACTN|nr:branched-chain amino acid ABC transporter permease [Nocardioides marmoriginsengisoli]RNL62487.1 branched-chain amino acid ABC transporter permease [Nocardioides marmoriginsengisoli]